MDSSDSSNDDAVDTNPKLLNTAPRIIALVVLPLAFTAFLLVTIGTDRLSAIVFGLGLVGLLVVELCRRWFSKASVKGDVLQDASTSLTVSVITSIMNNVFIIPLAYVWMKFLSGLTPLHLQDRISASLGDWALPVTLLIAIACADFLYYFGHRGAHRIELMWGSHSVHHSSEHFNPTTATRISFLDELWDLIMVSTMCLLGIGPLYALGAYAIVLLYQLPLHQTWMGRLPRWYEFVFNTPTHHRAHHAYQKIYIDKNFGGILIIWDRVFKSYADVEDAMAPEFGLTIPVGTYNPFKVLFGELGHMGSNVRHAKTFGEAVGYVFKQPYWSPSQ